MISVWPLSYVLSQNIVHGDALTMRMHYGQALTFAEWQTVGRRPSLAGQLVAYQPVGRKQEGKFWHMAESTVNTIVAAPSYRWRLRLGPTRVGFVQASLSEKLGPKNCSVAFTEISKNGNEAEL